MTDSEENLLERSDVAESEPEVEPADVDQESSTDQDPADPPAGDFDSPSVSGAASLLLGAGASAPDPGVWSRDYRLRGGSGSGAAASASEGNAVKRMDVVLGTGLRYGRPAAEGEQT